MGAIIQTAAFQTDIIEAEKNHWLATKELFHSITEMSSEQTSRLLESVEPRLKHALGTYTATCNAKPKYGYPPVTWTITALDAIPRDQIFVLYGQIRELCPPEDIIQTKGELGKMADIEKYSTSLAWLLLGITGLLILSRVIEIFILQRP